MLVVGYCFGIRSERRLCEEFHLNLAYRWFCRLGLEDSVPDNSTFSKNRHGSFRDNDMLRFVFEKVLARCISERLVGGEGFAVDASVIKADAKRQRGVPGRAREVTQSAYYLTSDFQLVEVVFDHQPSAIRLHCIRNRAFQPNVVATA